MKAAGGPRSPTAGSFFRKTTAEKKPVLLESNELRTNQNSKVASDDSTIYPVILRVPEAKRGLKGREKVRYLSRYAREALAMSAEKFGVRLGELLKNDNGAPLTANGVCWSLSHKQTYVTGVVAPKKIGIDLEEIHPCAEKLFHKIALPEEWSLADADVLTFFRYWTSKEAVLKTAGTGMKDLSKCRIRRILNRENLVVDYLNREWIVEHLYFDKHIASIVKNDFSVKWMVR
jgi:4'-phosphopantetheinyl transferase